MISGYYAGFPDAGTFSIVPALPSTVMFNSTTATIAGYFNTVSLPVTYTVFSNNSVGCDQVAVTISGHGR